MIAGLGALMSDPLCVLTQQYFDTTNVVMKPLSRSSAGTLYHQILLGLTEQIESGEIGVGDRLPSEADLVSDFGVSRTTARRALDELRRQGLVRREPGRGTFLASPRLRSNLAYLHSFTEEIERWGYTPGARLVSREERTADEEVAARLEIGVGERVLFVRRLRLADERPIFVCDSHLPVGRFPALKDADYGAISLSRLFEESTGRKVEYSRQWIGAATATPDVAALLEIPAGVPVLKVRRITLVTGDAPIELVEAHFHPERYQHYNELSTRPVEVPV
jgi:DNA-binding GntR family transcriptional regulator